MHTSTSPQYSIIASTDVSAKMMDDAGPALTDECIREAIDFRRAMLRIGRDLERAQGGRLVVRGLAGRRDRGQEPSSTPTPTARDLERRVAARSRASAGTASATSARATACSIRSRSRRSRPASARDGRPTKRRHPRRDRDGVPRHAGHRGREDRALLDPHALLGRHHAGASGARWSRRFMRFKELYDTQRAARGGAARSSSPTHPERYGRARPARPRRGDARGDPRSTTSSRTSTARSATCPSRC